ncbi:MAG: hypothetical protein Q9188_006270 [Gyalolechia gomerana]
MGIFSTRAVYHTRRPLFSFTSSKKRFTVTRCFGPNVHVLDHQFFRVTLRHGYTDEVFSQDLGLQIYEKLRSFIIGERAINEQTVVNSATANLSRKGSIEEITTVFTESLQDSEEQIEEPEPRHDGTPATSDRQIPTAQRERIRHELAALEAAYQDQVVYVVGKEQMRIREVTGWKPRSWFRRIALAAFLWLRSNTSSKVANLDVDIDKLVEIGFVKII